MSWSKRKILHIIPRLVFGGAEVLVSEYYNRLDPERYEVYVASVVDGGPLQSRFVDQSRLWVGSAKKMGGRFGVLSQLKTYVDILKPDIIHTHLLSGDLAGHYIKARRKNIIWISTLHNVEFHTPFLKRFLWRYILRSVDKVVAVSPAVANYAKGDFYIPEGKIKLIPNGIDLDSWPKVPTTSLLSEKTLRLAIIGRLEKQKGHRDLFLALNKLKNTDWTLDIFGEGGLESDLRHTAKSLRIDGRIRWRGAVDDMPSTLSEIDVVIQPSLWEGMSLVVMEAMAASRVVIASTAAGQGLIANEENGYVVEVGDSDSLARTMNHVMENKAEAKKIATAAREFAREYFSIEKHIEQIEELYDHVR